MLVGFKILNGGCTINMGILTANKPMGRSISIHADQFYRSTTQEFLAAN